MKNLRKLRIPKHLDKRRKLTDDQRAQIKKLFDSGQTNKSELARKFNVGSKLIGMICHPERMEHHLTQNREKNRGKNDKERNAATQNRYRKRKKDLFLDGKIKG